jgi:hypothetical protein
MRARSILPQPTRDGAAIPRKGRGNRHQRRASLIVLRSESGRCRPTGRPGTVAAGSIMPPERRCGTTPARSPCQSAGYWFVIQTSGMTRRPFFAPTLKWSHLMCLTATIAAGRWKQFTKKPVRRLAIPPGFAWRNLCQSRPSWRPSVLMTMRHRRPSSLGLSTGERSRGYAQHRWPNLPDECGRQSARPQAENGATTVCRDARTFTTDPLLARLYRFSVQPGTTTF